MTVEAINPVIQGEETNFEPLKEAIKEMQENMENPALAYERFKKHFIDVKPADLTDVDIDEVYRRCRMMEVLRSGKRRKEK
jgi:hypothetical protein